MNFKNTQVIMDFIKKVNDFKEFVDEYIFVIKKILGSYKRSII